MSGGKIGGNLNAADQSQDSVIAGTILKIQTQDQSTLALSGAVVVGLDVLAAGGSTIDMTGGSIADTLESQGTATINLAGGGIAGDLQASGNSLINMTAGTVDGGAFTHDHAVLNYIGGTILGGIHAAVTPATTSLPGLAAYDDSTINIYGTDLATTLLDPNFQAMFTEYQLTGTLSDGTEFSTLMFIQNGTGASFALLPPVPEPSTLLMFAVGGLSLAVAAFRRHLLQTIA
jgi:hypothetical protein